MLKRIIYFKYLMVMFGITISTFFFVKCIDKDSVQTKKIAASKFPQFSGSVSCIKCHQKIYESHIKTAHFLTSQKSDSVNIKGNFAEGKNKFYYSNDVYISLEKNANGFEQVAYVNGERKMSHSFDITVGSGKRGQTFLYWNQDGLFQLPITYFTSYNQWSNSPGYSNKIMFNRHITSRCLECHSTYFDKTSEETAKEEKFSQTDIVYGVDCEKCHGPASQHVEFHIKNLNEKKGQYIINPKSFTRQQSLDLCRLCHGGRLAKSKPSFSFEPGDSLFGYFTKDTAAKNIANIDVHGNQYGMLAASKCFKHSEMTCASCHSAHENETGKLSLFSQRCTNCHSVDKNNFCKEKTVAGSKNVQNCIDCHMPEQASKAITVLLQGETLPTSAKMRSHYISIYPDETKKILSFNKDFGKNNSTNHHKEAELK